MFFYHSILYCSLFVQQSYGDIVLNDDLTPLSILHKELSSVFESPDEPVLFGTHTWPRLVTNGPLQAALSSVEVLQNLWLTYQSSVGSSKQGESISDAVSEALMLENSMSNLVGLLYSLYHNIFKKISL